MICTKKIDPNIDGLVIEIPDRFQRQNIEVDGFAIRC